MDKKTASLIKQANVELSEASPAAGTRHPTPPLVSILSSDINRAVFSHTIIDKEPGPTIDDIVTMGNSGLSRVYFFNDIRHRAGDTLTHTWYRNGKKVVKVSIPVGSDTWRASSSKYLDKHMEGDWEVKVTDRKGILVASGAFEFSVN